MNQVLLVEGNDDRHVLWAICEKYKIKETFEIEDSKGIDNLLKNISTYIKSDQNAIGIIIDADINIISRWQSLKSILTEFEYSIPDEMPNEGFIVNHEEFPTIGIWIMPNNNENGMLEDFIQYLIPDSDQLIPYVDQSLHQIEDAGLNKYKLPHKSKATIHTWLAWQENPGTPMGSAITKTYLDTNQDLCNQFVNWLNQLFNPE